VHAVAVTRVRGLVQLEGGYREAPRALEEPPREEVVQALAAITGRDASDWRLRIGQPLPWVVAMEADAARAGALVVALRRKGLGAVSCDVTEAQPWAPRGRLTLALREDGIGFSEAARVVPYDAVRAVVRAMLDTETSTEEVEHVNVSVNPRNVPRTVPVSHYLRERSRSRALFLVLGAGEPDVRLVQGSVRLEGAAGRGSAMGSTSGEIFARVSEALLARLPDAFQDDRLLTARRGRSGFSTSSGGATHTTSNFRETDLIAHLIGLAWIEAQIDPPGAC
jgi:hypothetical protein